MRFADFLVCGFGVLLLLSCAPVETATKLLNTIESELDGCEGIAIELAELRSEATIALSDIRIMKRWDYYNDLTLRDDDQDAILPND